MFARSVKIKDLKKGDFFVLKNPVNIDADEMPEERVYVRGDYDRTDKKYGCYRFSDVNRESYFKGERVVYTDFTF